MTFSQGKNAKYSCFKQSLVAIAFIFSIFILFFVFPNSCKAGASLMATVVDVIDCNTLIVDKAGTRITVKLAGVAPPIANQPYSEKAKKYLENNLLNMKIVVQSQSDITNGNEVLEASVQAWLNGKKGTTNLNNKMIEDKICWTKSEYDNYCAEQKRKQEEQAAKIAAEARRAEQKRQAEIKRQAEERAAQARLAEEQAAQTRLAEERAREARRAEETKQKNRNAAEQGNAKAQFNLGRGYLIGEGVTQNYSEAVRWFRMAAKQGHAEAQVNLGRCYFLGNGVTQNYSEAVRWYRLAAKQGRAEAQFNLGVCYNDGKGVTQDSSEAVRRWRMAAEQGDADAQFALGVCYCAGTNVTQDTAEGMRWLRKAAEQGNAYAKEVLRKFD